MESTNFIEIEGAKQHNLKDISVRIPKGQLSVITGPSGSGKSSLAFNTLFAEGQRRYIESLSTYVRQFLDKHEKPDVRSIKGLSPTIAIEQKNHTKNSRSTVGTATEIYDYLRLFYAKVGVMYSPKSGEPVKKDLVQVVVRENLEAHKDCRAYVSFPLELTENSKIQDRKRLLGSLLERGFSLALLESSIQKTKKVEFLDIQEEVAKKKNELVGKAKKSVTLQVMVDRFALDRESSGRFEEALVQAYGEGYGRATLIVLDDKNKVSEIKKYTEYPSALGSEERFPDLSPLLFSFNSPMGACQNCNGFGSTLEIDPELIVPNPAISISQGAIEPLTKPSAKEWLKDLLIFCRDERISLYMPWSELEKKSRDKIWWGHGDFPGLKGMFAELEGNRYKMQVRVFLSRYRSPVVCSECHGSRLREESRHVFIQKKSISDLTSMSIEELRDWFEKTRFNKLEKETAKDVLPQIKARLDFLMRVGLNYLSLSRLAKTLSGGEAQRIALANQLGSRLTQTCYVLDEPSIGLHPKDTEKLIEIMKELASLRNAVVVVEHDPDIIQKADYLVDIGPDSGERGGELLFQGKYKDFFKAAPENSTTYKFLADKEHIPIPKRRRPERFKDRKRSMSYLRVKGCEENNLKKVELKIPLGMLSCVTGVSGSGKSSAVRQTLYPALAKIFMKSAPKVGRFESISGFENLRSVVMINQEPIGRSPRSNPVTYMKVYDEIRALFASTAEARKKNRHAGHFSFNVPGGRCDHCEGEGYQRVEMLFMEDIFVLCEHCEGKRFKPEILEIQYKGKNIYNVLQTTVAEARKFFAGTHRLSRGLKVLDKVGLGYLRLGQPATTLSGGESQRLKIARELLSTDNTNVIYILDEPTTGLHFRDVKVLIRVMQELVERGSTVVVVEHNVDVMKSADWVIDFGPEGGDKGGKIVVQGSPEKVATSKKSLTAPYLAAALEKAPELSLQDYLVSEAGAETAAQP